MKDIALVTNDFEGGGTTSMTKFLYKLIEDSGKYHPSVISIATSSQDEASVRVRDPSTWTDGPLVMNRTRNGIEYRHVGAWFCEIEPFRYQPRIPLNRVLSEFDLIQFVVGAPSWAYVAHDLERPAFLWTATTTAEDRETRHNTNTGPRNWWRRAMTRWAKIYERKALDEAETVFALSDYTRKNLKDQYSVDSEVATQGIDIDQFHPGDEQGKEYILTVSRLNDPRKRIPLLLKAYAEAKRTSEDVPPLYLVGDEPNRRIRRTAEELRVTEDVHFLGWKSRSALVSLYQNALCFVLSSDEEGLGIVILEAMACGQPVISTNCGGPETLVVDGETGFLTAVGDAQALGDKMVKLAEEAELRKKMGKAARRRVEDRFSIKAAKQTFLEAYEKY